MYNEAKEQYVYVIAGGETLQIIDHVKNQALMAQQELKDYVKTFGIRVSRLDGHNNADISYALIDEGANASVPKGWVLEQTRSGLFLDADYETVEGMDVASSLSLFQNKMNIQRELDNLCNSLAPSSHWNDYTYSFEEIGDDIVVACPKQTEGHVIIPTGSKVISYVDYINMQEKAKPTPVTKSVEFKNKFKP